MGLHMISGLGGGVHDVNAAMLQCGVVANLL